MMIDEREDMIVKAVSWALRMLALWQPEAVAAFVAEHEDRLAARVKREVRNKLRTGLKNPKGALSLPRAPSCVIRSVADRRG